MTGTQRRGRGAARTAVVPAVAFAALAFGTTGAASAQGLADFDYEDLSFRGIGFEASYVGPDRVDPTEALGIRIDLGYLGPGVRLLPRVSYWNSLLDAQEVVRLESRVESLIDRSTPPSVPDVDVDLGQIEWSDLTLGLDAQAVWSVPFDLLSYAGAGVAVHVLNGSGRAINDTFVEDLLDGTAAGVNAHLGLEYPITDRFRIYTTARYEWMEDLKYFQIGGGLQIMFSRPAPGEERTR